VFPTNKFKARENIFQFNMAIYPKLYRSHSLAVSNMADGRNSLVWVKLSSINILWWYLWTKPHHLKPS